jgi:uncharacterized protein (DUF1499 family)
MLLLRDETTALALRELNRISGEDSQVNRERILELRNEAEK